MGCSDCDFRYGCERKIRHNGELALIKYNRDFYVECQCVVQDICKSCLRFKDQLCASWVKLNGEKIACEQLKECPEWEGIV